MESIGRAAAAAGSSMIVPRNPNCPTRPRTFKVFVVLKHFMHVFLSISTPKSSRCSQINSTHLVASTRSELSPVVDEKLIAKSPCAGPSAAAAAAVSIPLRSDANGGEEEEQFFAPCTRGAAPGGTIKPVAAASIRHWSLSCHQKSIAATSPRSPKSSPTPAPSSSCASSQVNKDLLKLRPLRLSP